MENILQNIDWMSLIGAVWTIIFVPIGKAIYEWFKAHKLDKYADILYKEVKNAVKSVQEVYVNDLKANPDLWTEDKKQEVKELAKAKAIQALSSIAYKTLKEANEDFDLYLDNLVGTALFDIKNGK